jgi:predicted metalloprotease with PDZ domain
VIGARWCLALAPLFGLACHHAARTAPAAPEPGPGAWTYEVVAGPEARELTINASFPAGSELEFTVDEGAEPFVRDVAVQSGARWDPVAPHDGSWTVLACRSGCALRYRFLLADATRTIRDPEVAIAHQGALLAPPSTWLLRPVSGPGNGSFRFHVATPPGVAFATGVAPAPSAPGWYEATVADLPSAPYSGFGRLAMSKMDVGARTFDIARAPGEFAAGEDAVLEWIRTSAEAVSNYFGHFPVDRTLLLVVPNEGEGFGYGKALGNGGASILLPIGQRTSRAKLADDWVLVHEMVHLAFPSLERRHLWLGEGLATYIEPIARARIGKLAPEVVWEGLVHGLPHGLPEAGDEGLDNTHTWGRTYWGGALYCLLSDLEIRERTHNTKSLDDAMRAVLDQGGNIAVRWEIGRALEVGDKATGVPVLREQYDKMKNAPFPVDLPKLWKRLGVSLTGSQVTFDDTAPLAAVRRSMTQKNALADQEGPARSIR